MRRVVIPSVLAACLPVCLTCAPTAAAEDVKAKDRERQHFDGFSFEIPDGWKRIQPDTTNTKAMLLVGADRWYLADGMIKIDVGKPVLRSAKAFAQKVAKDFDGKVMPEPVRIDGEEGLHVVTSSTDHSRPREVIIVPRDGKVYLLMASAREDADVSKALKAVRDTWKWETGKDRKQR